MNALKRQAGIFQDTLLHCYPCFVAMAILYITHSSVSAVGRVLTRELLIIASCNFQLYV